MARLPGDERADLHQVRFHSDRWRRATRPRGKSSAGQDSYDRRLGFTISEGFFACLTTAPQACLPRRGRQRYLIRFALVPAARPRVVLLEEPCLVGEHDRLYAVAEVELLKDVGDVGLDGGLADIKLVPDLCV